MKLFKGTTGEWLRGGMLALFALALTIGLVVRFSPGLQADLLHARLAETESAVYDFAAVELGWGHVRLTEFFALVGNQGVQVPAVELHGNVLAWWFQGTVSVRSGQANNVFLDLSQLRAAEAGRLFPEVTDAAQAHTQVQLALDRIIANWADQATEAGYSFSLRDVTIEGAILLPGLPLLPQRLEIVQLDVSGSREWHWR